MGGRNHDKFAGTLWAATTGLILTNHTQDVDGVQRVRPSLLDSLDIEYISRTAHQQLLSANRTLLDTIRSMLTADDAASSEVTPDE